MSITILIIIITCLVSFAAFSNEKILNDLIFYPPAVANQNQWYRFFSCGLIHADWGHLIFNMISLYLFGQGFHKDGVEFAFAEIFGGKGKLLYLLMYILSLAVCLLPTYSKNKDNYHYRSLGASGAVSAVIFAGVLLFPTAKMGLFFIPPIIPAYIFGPIYLLGSYYLDKKQSDNINHSAHIWGALFGVAFLVVTCYVFTDFRVLSYFIDQIRSTFGG